MTVGNTIKSLKDQGAVKQYTGDCIMWPKCALEEWVLPCLRQGMRLIKLKVYIVCSLGAGLRSAPGRQVYFRLWSPNISRSCSGFLTRHAAQSNHFTSWFALRQNGGNRRSSLTGSWEDSWDPCGYGQCLMPRRYSRNAALTSYRPRTEHPPASVSLASYEMKSGSGMGADVHLEENGKPTKEVCDS